MKGNLKNLSLARGALLLLNENTAGYKKRMGQITSLETSLKNNPVFTKHDLLGSRDPFLYDHNSNKIYRKDDIIIIRNGTFLVENFNFKKQELHCVKLESEEKQRERINNEKAHGGRGEKIVRRSFSLPELNGNGRRYSYNEALYHLEKTSEDEQEMIKNIGNEKFYKLPEDKKEKYYDMHLAIIKESYSDNFNPVIFSIAQDGRLETDGGRYNSKDAKLNPFSAGGRMSILKALEKGINYPDYGPARDTMLETLGKTIPELKDCITQAIDKAEQQKQAKKQENALKEATLTQAAIKTGADKKHLEKHVHVVKF
jgi:hypothetical protein